MDKIAIRAKDVSKIYKLYHKPSERLLDALGIAGKNRFKEHRALDHVSFEVKKGETIGIIGTNGSGKSTILKIITGVLSPTEGAVEISGRISALLELGAGFNMEYTGIENVYLNGMMMGFRREEMDERLPEILTVCGYRGLCQPAVQDVFERNVCAPCVCRGDQYRPGDFDRG